MQLLVFLTAVIGLSGVTALQSPHLRAQKHKRTPRAPADAQYLKRAAPSAPAYLNPKTKPFAVDGANFPQVPFNIGESYAGLLPISNNTNDPNKLFFWFFPSTNPKAGDEIAIWLNGGPGCSSLDGLLQENGPFLWQSGTYSPKPNPYSYTNLTNVVYIDQPIGTGFSPAAPGAPAKIVNEDLSAADFLGFWKNFMETFGLKGRKVYILGESYAGQYIPYIAYHMLQAKDTDYYNVKGIQINDPSVNYDDVILEAPSVPALNVYSNVMNLNDTFMAAINQRAQKCGYIDFMNNALQFPPKGKLPSAPSSNRPGCDVWDDIIEAATYVNPCFNVYHLIDFCPFLSDEMGFPSLGWGPNNYFNQSAVQKALHVPPTDYTVCGDNHLGLQNDRSPPSALGPLPHVIEATNNVLIGHGNLDFLLFTNGTLATIQNMTWNGKQGFQTRPSDKFFVPYHPDLREFFFGGIVGDATQVAGAGYLGITHTERGLTFCTVDHSGHEIPQYAPGAAFRQVEFLLGRISSLTQMGDFTTETGDYTGTMPL